MPLFLAALLGGLVQAASSIVGRVLIALGIGYVSYTGINALLTLIKSQVVSYLVGSPGTVVAIMGLLNSRRTAVHLVHSGGRGRHPRRHREGPESGTRPAIRHRLLM